ncbi:hypothetical protein [Streptomyces sp. NPDC005408]|uniref:hypothetical protein n=1 Tax=Streptomyces sp. NPDC005408 TaxID=3155341 RepID=UPI0033AB3266
MAETLWDRFVRHPWLPQTTGVAVVAAIVAGIVLVRIELREDDNADLLATACAGVLPQQALREVLPGDERWQLRTDRETVGRPGSRVLMKCSLGRGEEQGIEITAVPVLDAPVQGVRLRDLLDSNDGDPYWAGAYQEADAHVTAECPKGLPGYPRSVTRFRVHASLRIGDDGTTSSNSALNDAVAAVANHVRTKGGCGGEAVDPAWVLPRGESNSDDDSGDPDVNAPDCPWFKPELLGDGWTANHSNSRQGGDPAWSRACAGTLEQADAPSEQERFAAVTSASWWGAALPEVRIEYGEELAAAKRNTLPPKGKRRSYPVAVWAEAVCPEGTSLHRVTLDSVTRGFTADHIDGLLDRYLDAAKCHDTKVLGKVWK